MDFTFDELLKVVITATLTLVVVTILFNFFATPSSGLQGIFDSFIKGVTG